MKCLAIGVAHLCGVCKGGQFFSLQQGLLPDIDRQERRLASREEPPILCKNQQLSKLRNRIARPILIFRRHLDMIDDEKRDGARLRFQFQPELLLNGR